MSKILAGLVAAVIATTTSTAFAQKWCNDDELEFHVVQTDAGFGVVSSKSGLAEYRIPTGKEKTLLPYVHDGNNGINYRLDFVLSEDEETLFMIYNSTGGAFLYKGRCN